MLKTYNEDSFLIALVRAYFYPAGEDIYQNYFRENLNWDDVLLKTQEQGLSGFLYRCLKDKTLSPQIKTLRDELKRHYLHSVAVNTRIAQDAKIIVEALRGGGIAAILLKGLDLVWRLYGDIGLRACTDLDILITRRGLAAANGVLLSLGYKQPAAYDDFLRLSGPACLNSLVYKKDGGACPVHLHWHLVNSTWPIDYLTGKIDMEKIWGSAYCVSFEGITYSALAQRHLLLYLSYHVFNHHFDRLILALDIAKVLETYKDSLDWDLLIREAGDFGVLPQVYYSLKFISKNFKLDTPRFKKIEEILINAKNWSPTGLRPRCPCGATSRAAFIRRLTAAVLSQRDKLIVSSFDKKNAYKTSYFFYLMDQGGLLAKLRFILRTFFPSRYVMAHNLNISVDKVRFRHYLYRIKSNLVKL